MKLSVKYYKKENDLVISYPDKDDGWEMHYLLKSEAFAEFKKQLEKRGYDFKTLKISLEKSQN